MHTHVINFAACVTVQVDPKVFRKIPVESRPLRSPKSANPQVYNMLGGLTVVCVSVMCVCLCECVKGVSAMSFVALRLKNETCVFLCVFCACVPVMVKMR